MIVILYFSGVVTTYFLYFLLLKLELKYDFNLGKTPQFEVILFPLLWFIVVPVKILCLLLTYKNWEKIK